MRQGVSGKVLLSLALATGVLSGVAGCADDDAINYQEEQEVNPKLNNDKTINYSKIQESGSFATINSGVEGETDFEYKKVANYLTQNKELLPGTIYNYKDLKNLVGDIEISKEVGAKVSLLYKENKLHLLDLQLAPKLVLSSTSDSSSKDSKDKATDKETKNKDTDNDKKFKETQKQMSKYLNKLVVDLANELRSNYKYASSLPETVKEQDLKTDKFGQKYYKDGKVKVYVQLSSSPEQKSITLKDFKEDTVGFKYYQIGDNIVVYNVSYELDDEGEKTPSATLQVSSMKHFQANQRTAEEKASENVAHDHDGDGIADHDAHEHNDNEHGKVKEFDDVE